MIICEKQIFVCGGGGEEEGGGDGKIRTATRWRLQPARAREQCTDSERYVSCVFLTRFHHTRPLALVFFLASTCRRLARLRLTRLGQMLLSSLQYLFLVAIFLVYLLIRRAFFLIYLYMRLCYVCLLEFVWSRYRVAVGGGLR